ncbi:MAG: hypothetical protein BWY57_02264 [Betaproteobacteria bacterium ADurb.Bin341]|nr:MAG: hypothetical protein BWY57_02264 [Betaproteobacteria bacterium ADurb.Bin341]
MGKDVDRVFIIDQRVETVAGRVLDPVLVADQLGKRLVGAGGFAHAFEPIEQGSVALTERGDAFGIFGVQHCPIGQHHAQSGQGGVTVLARPATHAGSVVGGNTADFAGVDRSWIGGEFAAKRSQPGVDLTTDHAGSEADGFALGSDVAGGETVADHGQDAVRDRLAGKAGAGGAKRHRALVFPCRLEQGLNLLLVFDPDHHFRDEPVEAGVGAVGKAPQVIGNDPLFWQKSGKCSDQRAHSFLLRGCRCVEAYCKPGAVGLLP